MSSEVPNIDPFENAIQRLDEGLARYLQDESDTQIRDGLIQRFEFTYELSHKTLKRYLRYASANPRQYDEMEFPSLIRSANEQDLLLGEWSDWRSFREMRDKTSHACNEEVAIDVVGGIPRFLREAAYLCGKLRDRLG